MSIWLPEGEHMGLLVEHSPAESAGGRGQGGRKWCWHTTESDWATVDSMVNVVRAKRAAPHFVLGGRNSDDRPVVVQMVSLDEAGRTLMHPSGPETNRANVVQVELCGRAAQSGEWHRDHYKILANLVRLANRRMPDELEVPRKLARRFANTDRFSGNGFVRAEGHCGHMHVPGNFHVDPGDGFRGQLLMSLLKNMPEKGYKLESI
jgi:hypothetical protein